MTIRRFVLCIALGSASGWGVNAEAAPNGPAVEPAVEVVAPSDTTAELSWAGRLIRLYSTLAEIKARPTHDNVPGLVSKAFADAHLLARTPGMLQSASFRAMYVDVHRLYELHHTTVAPIALTRTELVTLRETQFATLATVDPTLLLGEDLRLPLVEPEPEPEEPGAAIPVALRVPPHAESIVAAQQRRMMRQYGGLRGMQRTSRHYFPMITRALRQRGVPQELKYVAVIESSLDPSAESEAGAIGLWQFLPSTGEMYGLSEGDLYNPSRSTYAAARHLQRLGRMFNGDWQLALAAYNSGGGRVRAAVRQARRRLGRQPTFWDIYQFLPAETRNYVPKFIATARVMGG
ncbi:MAG: lytic transglycosylase domain-containing protein [Bacteroidetes bacterium]|nr:lytic transglycosylase domain-containing protein [Bacteroidota bacterium]